MDELFSTNRKEPETLSDLIDMASSSKDFMRYKIKNETGTIYISYIKTLIDMDTLHRDILPCIQYEKQKNLEDLEVPIDNILLSEKVPEIKEKLLSGYIILQFEP